MMDDRNEIRHLNWNEIFSFTHIFKGFRLAIHPSKMFLALAAIVLLWLVAMGMDRLWRVFECGYVGTSDVATYAIDRKGYDATVKSWKEGRPAQAARLVTGGRSLYIDEFNDSGRLRAMGIDPDSPLGKEIQTRLEKPAKDLQNDPPKEDKLIEQGKKDLGDVLSTARKNEKEQTSTVLDILNEANGEARKQIDDGKGIKEGQKKEEAEKQVADEYAAARKGLVDLRIAWESQYTQTRGVGIFDAFGDFEWACIYNGLVATAHGNFTNGLLTPLTAGQEPGMLTCAKMAALGFAWLLSQHTIFGVILLLVGLAIWAFFGGAIHRIAALHAARDEKISIIQAMRFACSKWPSFFTAPLIPLAAIAFLGVLILLTGLVGNLWGAGSIIMGVVMFLAIICGAVVAFGLFGLVGGAGLMYPTIAVEGSDSFDAISRSFAYVLTKPWRAGWYALVALVYGAICYLFVRLFAYLALAATWLFVSWGVFQGGQTIGADNKLPVMWTAPTFTSLHGNFNWLAMDGWEKIGAFFIWIYVALVAAAVGAFLLSYASSASTLIYYVLRRKVDATDFDDVYVQDSEDKQPASAAAPAAAPQAPEAGASSDDTGKTA